MSEETKAPDAVPEIPDNWGSVYHRGKVSPNQFLRFTGAEVVSIFEKWAASESALTEANRKLAEAEAQVQSENAELKTAYAQLVRKEREMLVLREALVRLRYYDWVITPADRMDAVRTIAREALAAQEALSREGQDGGAQ
jgi:hypothetical protein